MPTIAHAQSVEQFYRGKTLNLILATDPGGGYEFYGQLISKYLPKYLPGHPSIILQFMPGGGGVTAANYMYKLAPKDGTYLAITSNDAAEFQILDGRGVAYDAGKFGYVGRAASMQYVVTVWHASGVKSLEDMKTKEVIFGSTGPSQSSYTIPVLLKKLFHLKSEVLIGYQSTSQINIALENGEVSGRAAAWSSISAQRPDWFANETLQIIAQSGLERAVDIPNAPLLLEMARSDEERRLLEIFASDAAVGRSVVVPPGVPNDRLAALRSAFSEMLRDPDLLQDANKTHIDIEPWDGDKVQTFVDSVIASPPALVSEAKDILASK